MAGNRNNSFSAFGRLPPTDDRAWGRKLSRTNQKNNLIFFSQHRVIPIELYPACGSHSWAERLFALANISVWEINRAVILGCIHVQWNHFTFRPNGPVLQRCHWAVSRWRDRMSVISIEASTNSEYTDTFSYQHYILYIRECRLQAYCRMLWPWDEFETDPLVSIPDSKKKNPPQRKHLFLGGEGFASMCSAYGNIMRLLANIHTPFLSRPVPFHL